jgi:dihydrofolate synthase/folylpolyglutamate synthase
MTELLGSLGNPQLAVPTVHIAGSKGKGSTATMVARIAEAAGYRTGLFTSPHVFRFEERFTIDGTCPAPADVVQLWDRVRPVAEAMDSASGGRGPTFFELATAMAWLYFLEQDVDLAVMEVGLGGRLDSTNVCAPLVTAITSISRDHMRLLGEQLEQIAREKAGIIKTGIPVVIGPMDSGPEAVISSIAAEKQAPLYRLGKEVVHLPHCPGPPPFAEPPVHRFDFDGCGVQLKSLQCGMAGEHQTRNAAVATTLCLLLRNAGFTLTEQSIRNGLAMAHCPLRVEVAGRRPLIIVDAAHNPASITALCETVGQVRARHRIAIFATSRDKETAVLMEILNRHFDEIWLTRFQVNPRAVDLSALEQLGRQVITRPSRTFADLSQALAAAREPGREEDLVCVTGSFFLAAEARHLLVENSAGC